MVIALTERVKIKPRAHEKIQLAPAVTIINNAINQSLITVSHDLKCIINIINGVNL